jgi:hypothetical protein
VTKDHNEKAAELIGDEQRWRELGIALHEKMAAAIAEAGISIPDHPDDDEHNIAVGRTLDMILRGDVMKGVHFYCSWAKEHGYPGIGVTSWGQTYLQIDIGTAIGGMIAELRDGEVTILTVGEWIRPGFVRAPQSFFTPVALWGRLILPVRTSL